MRERVAHFLLIPELAYSPPNDALISAWIELGFAVDVFAPGGSFDVTRYGDSIRALPVEYGYRWLLANLCKPTWRNYRAFSGTTEDPLAIVGALGRFWRRPIITLADEIKSGSYAGDRSARWKRLCQRGMRASALTIVNEAERITLQRDYADLTPTQDVMVYPGGFREPPIPIDRGTVRRDRGISDDAFVLCYSGTFNFGNGGLWLADALKSVPDLHVWGQILHSDPLVHGLLTRIYGAERLHLESARLGWREAWATSAAADVGMVVYLQDAPQFQHMGIASNRLCMFLAMGVPVIASRQPSFEFIESFNAGVLLEDSSSIADALESVRTELPKMRKGAKRAWTEYVQSTIRYEGLVQQLNQVMSK
jgi:glycosyltransferase involved in cell wall biosynthesis